jgi:hypothetical protein
VGVPPDRDAERQVAIFVGSLVVMFGIMIASLVIAAIRA